MGSLGVLVDRKVRYIGAAVVVALAMLLPALVSADQVTGRSVALSSASASATGVTYEVKFTTKASMSAFVVDFCQESPLVGSTCTKPTGFSAAAASSTTEDLTDVTTLVGDKTVVVASDEPIAAGNISVELDGITNPSSAGVIYARVITYASDTAADAYTSTNVGAKIDDGGMAIPISDTASVSGLVLESLQFCVASASITANCGNASSNAPAIQLGHGENGATKAITSTEISEGNIFTQISTNAVSGAVVSLKSLNACGGLKRVGVETCDITPANTTPITAGAAKFGMKVATDTDPVGVAVGTARVYPGSGYNGSSFLFNFATGENPSSGVTAPYGDKIIDTNNAPAANKNMKLTFGATSSNVTPAGTYANTISLIATGTF